MRAAMSSYSPTVILTIFFSVFYIIILTAKAQWNTFSNLSGTKIGEEKPGLSSIKRYLDQFGYLNSNSTSVDVPHDDKFDHELESAVIEYQRYFHLNTTGRLDEPTVATMMKPRCGVADHHVHRTNTSTTTVVHGRNLYVDLPGNPVWPPQRRSLKYAFSTYGTSIGSDVLSRVFARAFGRWQAVTNVNFTEVPISQPHDITLHFYVGDHGDGFPFDNQLGVLAHSFPPTDGELHFDGAERWTASPHDAASPDLYNNQFAIELESVAVHEIGHILGLDHTPVPDAVMYAMFHARTRKVTLSPDDIQGIQNLYGVK